MHTPAWLSSSIFYELYPQSFYDTNGDGIGDLEGVIRKLDYIKSLGCDAVWMNPCFASPFGDAGYDVSDFYQVAPRYGTNEDLARLFREAHRRGMRICLDLVAGHTSNQHPWFKESAKAIPNKYSNWYVWSRSVWENDPGMITGFSERDGNYLANFFAFQPSLNYGYANPDPEKPWQLPVTHPDVQAVRAELFKIMRFWMDMGADGFRVDMAHSLVKGDKDLKATMVLWKEVRDMFDKDYPDCALLSEWSDPSKSIPGGFHVDFMLAFGQPPAYISLLRKEKGRDLNPFAKGGCSFFSRQGEGNIRDFLDTYLRHYEVTKNLGYIAIPSGNHDCTRLAIERSPREMELVFAFLMTMPGVPFIYNGDEIGVRQGGNLISKEGGYDRTGARTPMQWSRGANAGFSTADSSRLYLPIDSDPERPNVADQENDPHSLLSAVRRLAAFRKANSAFWQEGSFTPLLAESCRYPFVYERANAAQRFVVAINPGEKPVEVSFEMKQAARIVKPVMGNETQARYENGNCKFSMPGVAYVVFEVN
jgi:maltose alpha-D-glucosyltransferase/alpha-amylase